VAGLAGALVGAALDWPAGALVGAAFPLGGAAVGAGAVVAWLVSDRHAAADVGSHRDGRAGPKPGALPLPTEC